MLSLSNFKNKPVLVNLCICSSLFLLFFTLYTPIFETNDDVGMAMTAHGFGASLYPSAHIMFSNVIYGWIVCHLPTIMGIYPYFYLTFFALFVVSFSLLCCFDALAMNKFLSIALIIMVLSRAVAMPQFTVNAGFLALTSVVAILTYHATSNFKYIILAMLIAFYSYLIRSQELYFIFIVALPFLFNRNLLNKKFLVALVILISSCFVAKYINVIAYKETIYADYNALLKYRVAFNDYHAAEYFIQRPEILKNFEYTANDMKLLRDFIFADPALASPLRMQQLLANFKLTTRVQDNFSLAIQSLRSIYDQQFQLLILVAVLGTVFSKNKMREILAWSVFIMITVFLGLLGRPSILRINYPIIALLAISPY